MSFHPARLCICVLVAYHWEFFRTKDDFNPQGHQASAIILLPLGHTNQELVSTLQVHFLALEEFSDFSSCCRLKWNLTVTTAGGTSAFSQLSDWATVLRTFLRIATAYFNTLIFVYDANKNGHGSYFLIHLNRWLQIACVEHVSWKINRYFTSPLQQHQGVESVTVSARNRNAKFKGLGKKATYLRPPFRFTQGSFPFQGRAPAPVLWGTHHSTEL